MFKERLSKAEVEILLVLAHGPRSVTDISEEIHRSLPWTSLSIKHLSKMGFVSTEGNGVTHTVSIRRDPLGSSIMTLLHESPGLGHVKILSGQGLKVLSYLIGPPRTVAQLSSTNGLTEKTVRGTVKRLSSMGMVKREKCAYSFNDRYAFLRRFLEEYVRHRNLVLLEDELSTQAVIVWQKGNRMIVSTDLYIEAKGYIRAAYSRMDELGYPIVHMNEYYMRDPFRSENTLEEEEALIQALIVDPINPRVPRFIMDSLRRKKVDRISLVEWGIAYGLEKTMFDLIKRNDIIDD